MDLILLLAKALTVGIVIGFVAGLVRLPFRKPEKADKTSQFLKKIKRPKRVINFLAVLVLLIALIWTTYFMVLGLTEPEQAAYATNVSQLIVSVVTVFSIIIAFMEYLNRK